MADNERKTTQAPRDLAHNTIERRFTDTVRSAFAFVPEKLRAPTMIIKRPKRIRRDRHKRIKVAFFRYSYYGPAFKYFVEQVLDAEYLPLPEATRRTVEQGAQHSSDYVCTPFKHMLGDYIEALELGADVLVQFGGFCRLSYYGELHELILRDLGYEFQMLNFAMGLDQGYLGFAKECLKTVNADIAIAHGVRQLLATASMVNKLDEAYDFYLANAGFEVEEGAFRRTWKAFLDTMASCTTAREISDGFNHAMEQMRSHALDKPSQPIRIGIVGEIFTAIDAHSNLDLDEKLLAMGVELHRMVNLSNRMISYNEENMRVNVGEYLAYDAGPTSTITVAAAKKYAESGFDGIIHVKSAGCTPEIDCVAVLQRLAADYRIPVLYLTYDAQTSDTGLDTRLEAFYDMLAMKKEAKRR